jgi:alpha-galactosidase
MRGLRVIPHAVAIARDIVELCPGARVLNLANPLSAVCRAMVRETGLAVVGLCEQWKVTLRPFSEALGVPPGELDCLSAGINHLTWALALRHGGRDVLPEVLFRLGASGGNPLSNGLPVSREIYEAFGLWPTGTEDHIAEFFPYFLTPEARGGADYGLVTRRVTRQEVESRTFERTAMAEGRLSIAPLLGPSGESAVEIVASLIGVEGPGLHMVNLPNSGLIDNLPPEAIVELQAQAGPFGLRGLKVGPFPRALACLLGVRVAQQELLVDAALTGDRRTALQGLLLDAQVLSLKTARSLLSESIEANAGWLPSFG